MYNQPIMNVSLLKSGEFRDIYAASFVERHPDFFPSNKVNSIFPHHLLYFHLQGDRSMILDNRKYDFKTGDIIFLHEGRLYTSFKPLEKYRALNIQFNKNQDDLYVPSKDETNEFSGFYPAIPALIRKEQHFPIQNLFSEIILASNSSMKILRERARILLPQLLWEISYASFSAKPLKASSLDRIILYIEKNLKEEFSLSSCAEMAGMSKSSFTPAFRKHTGLSLKQFHLKAKINAAENIIKNDPFITLKEIADILNFYDEFHFSRTFKKKVGISPSLYRKNNPGQEPELKIEN